jgi:RNA polymerase sigma factor (sigma-70 family)
MTSNTLSASEREALFRQLYTACFPAVAQYIRSKGGTLEETQDVFQDALLVFYEKSLSDPGAIGSQEGYVYGAARHLWHRKYRENSRSETLYDHAAISAETDPEISDERLLRYLELAGEKCLQLLRAVYYHRFSMTDIASRFGFSGERSAAVQKHKCIERLRKEIRERSLTYTDFYE